MDKFYALADPNRRKILELLASHGELSASEISEKFQVSPSAISQHLKALREAGLVRMEKRAQQRIYQINPQSMHELEGWAHRLAQVWTQRLDALDALLQAEQQRTSQSTTRKENDAE
jgi:DNA-binding transcriptional ArsR family regulator